MNDHHLNITIKLYESLENQLSQLAGKANTIENVLLSISVVTSGGLWLLAVQVLPQTTTWAGAALSTLATGLTLYLYSSGVNKKRERAIDLHSEVSRFLARIRGNPKMEEGKFWESYKLLEHKIRTLCYNRD